MKQASIKKNSILNTFRQFCTIAYGLITLPYVSRILGADNLGKISFISSVVNYFAIIASFGISSYAIREGARIRDDKDKTRKLVSELISLNIFTSVISYFLLLLTFIFWNKLNNYSIMLFVHSLTIISNTLGIEWFFQIYENYTLLSIKSIIVHLLSIILVFTTVKTSKDYILYAAILIIMNLIFNIISFYICFKEIGFSLTFRINLKTHFKPLFILFINTIITSIYVSSDMVLLGIMKNDAEVGIYGSAVKIYSILKNIINPLVIVVLPRLSSFANCEDKTKYNYLSHKLFIVLITIVLPTATGLFLLSSNALLIVFGSEFISGFVSLKILSLSLIFSVLATFLTSAVLIPNKKEKLVLIATSLGSVFNIILNIILIPEYGMNGAAFTTFISEICIVFIAGICAKNYMNYSILSKDIYVSMLGCIGIFLVFILSNTFELQMIYDTIIKISLSILVYFSILFFFKQVHYR